MLSVSTQSRMKMLLAMLLSCVYLCPLIPRALGDQSPERIIKELVCDESTVSINAVIDSVHISSLPAYTAKLQVWDEDILARYSMMIKQLQKEEPFRFDLDEGVVFLIDEVRFERAAFLKDARESFHYMTARSDAFYDNAYRGMYFQTTFSCPRLEEIFQFDTFSADDYMDVKSFLFEEGIEVGDPLQMTTYTNLQ